MYLKGALIMAEKSKTESSIFELYKLYVDTAEKVSDRRSSANTWMLSVNTALVGFYAFLERDKEIIVSSDRQIWLLAIPVTGLIISIAWLSLLVSYRKLNQAKFHIIHEIEEELPYKLFFLENIKLKEAKHWGLSNIESWIPMAFFVLYFIIALSSFLPDLFLLICRFVMGFSSFKGVDRCIFFANHSSYHQEI